MESMTPDVRGTEREAPVLQVSGLSKRFGGVAAADDVSFRIDAGERSALIGPNGAGKTTVFNLISGFQRPDRGSVSLFGVDVTAESPNALARQGLVRSFQVARVFDSLPVLENVIISIEAARGQSWGLSRTRESIRSEASDVLSMVGLADRPAQHASSLAHGDRKRLEFAMVMSQQPALVLMDEPTAGLTPWERREIMALLMDAVPTSVPILFTEHAMDVVFGNADRVIVMDHGKIVADGDPDAIASSAHLQEIYFGSDGAGS